jgi:hypothetical protein
VGLSQVFFFLATLDANAFDVPFGWMIVVKNYRIQTCLLLLPCFWELTGFADWDGWHTTICANISNNQLNNPTSLFKFLEANFGPPQMAPF